MIQRTTTLWPALGLLFCLTVTVSAQTATPPCTPNMRFGSVLKGVSISSNGQLMLRDMVANCLPEPARPSNSNYPYDPDGGGTFTTVLKKSNGAVLTTYVWYVEKVSSLWLLNRYKVVGGPAAAKPLAPGDYVLEFAVENKPFHRFAFSVATVNSTDIYAPGTIYLLNGAWNDYGAFWFYKPDRYTQFLVCLREAGTPKKQPTTVVLQLLRAGDGKVIATNRDGEAVRLTPEWNLFKLSFNPVLPNGEPAQGGEYHASEVLAVDGNYVVRLRLDGKLYGEYGFTVKGGQIQFQGRQTRDPANPLLLIEDVGNTWWLKRKTAP